MYITEKLAELALSVRPQDMPDTVKMAGKRCILDILGAAWAGHKTQSASALNRMIVKNFASGSSSIWFSGDKMTASAAASANAASASALDLDDGHRGAAGHPGASIIPAVFAVAEEMGSSGNDVLAATVIGYDVACRVGSSRDFAGLPTLSTGRWCAYGAAAAVSWLRGLPASVLAHALAISGSLIPDLASSGYSKVMGNHVKEGIPWATMLGVVAVDLAMEGYTGPLDLLDHRDYFDPDKIMAEQGSSWAIENVYFKPYSSCRWSHAAIDCLTAILKENALRPDSISKITVETFERALRLNNYPDPDSLEAAQYSIPFCMGVVAVKGPSGLLPLSTASLNDADIVSFANRVTLEIDKDMTAMFPGKTPAKVIVETSAGRVEKTAIDPRGDIANPMTQEELETKFRNLTSGFLTNDRQSMIIQSVMEMDRGERGLTGLTSLFNYGKS